MKRIEKKITTMAWKWICSVRQLNRRKPHFIRFGNSITKPISYLRWWINQTKRILCCVQRLVIGCNRIYKCCKVNRFHWTWWIDLIWVRCIRVCANVAVDGIRGHFYKTASISMYFSSIRRSNYGNQLKKSISVSIRNGNQKWCPAERHNARCAVFRFENKLQDEIESIIWIKSEDIWNLFKRKLIVKHFTELFRFIFT